jgi:hypothetical protein
VTGIWACIGAAALVAGSFMSWVTVTTIFGQISINGFDGGDGKITAGAGLVALGFLVHGVTNRNWSSYLIGALAAIVGALVAVYDFVNISDNIDSGDGFTAQHGVGIYACCLGGVIATVAGFAAMSRARADRPWGGLPVQNMPPPGQ